MKPYDSMTWSNYGTGNRVGPMRSSGLSKSLPDDVNMIIKRQDENPLQYTDSNKFTSLPQTLRMIAINLKMTTKNEKTTQNSTVYFSDKNNDLRGKSNKETEKNNVTQNSTVYFSDKNNDLRGKSNKETEKNNVTQNSTVYFSDKNNNLQGKSNKETEKNNVTQNSTVYFSDKNNDLRGKSNKETEKNHSNVPLEKRGKEALLQLYSKGQKLETNSHACKQLKHKMFSSNQTSPKSLYGGEENEDEAKINTDMGEAENPEKIETQNYCEPLVAAPCVILKEYSSRDITSGGTENQLMKNYHSAVFNQLKKMLKSGELCSVFSNADPVTMAKAKNLLNTMKNKPDLSTNERSDVIMNMAPVHVPQPMRNDISESASFGEPMKQSKVEADLTESKILSSLPVEGGTTIPESDNKEGLNMHPELYVAPDGGHQKQTKEPQMPSQNKVVYLEEFPKKTDLTTQSIEPQMPSKKQYHDRTKEFLKQRRRNVGKKDRESNITVDRTKCPQILAYSSKIKEPKRQKKSSSKIQRLNNMELIKKNTATLDVFKKPKRLDMKKGGNFRCCSQGGASGSGNGNGYQNRSSGGSKDFSNNPNKEQPNEQGSEHGRGNGDKPNDRGNNSPNQSNPVSFGGEQNMIPGVTGPAPNFKLVRKKGSFEDDSWGPDKLLGHGCTSDQCYLIVAIGRLSSEDHNIIFDPDLTPTFRQIEQCLVQYLHSLSTGRGQYDKADCDICDIVISLLRHFGRHSDALMTNCTMCLQLYRLFKFHLAGCCVSAKPLEECTHSLSICQQIHCQATSYADDHQAFEKFLWQQLKERFCLHFGNVNLPPSVQPQKKAIPAKRQSLKRKVSVKATLRKIPEDECDGESTKRQSVEGLAESQFSICSLLRNMPEMPQPLPPRHGKVETPDRDIHVYRDQGCQSVPTVYFPRNPEMLISFEDRPTGVPGIGEVIYGSHSNLRQVAEHWSSLRENRVSGLPSSRQQREEGVILKQHMYKLLIGKTRFQEGVQWEKLSPLGQGVSGQCYLARDYNSEIQFCVKQIPLMKYFQDELTIWSKLNHPNIVQLYGAIRCGDTVYILAEFVDGGCLTEHINNQRELNRRLSKPVALRYFQQLLQVLVYLQEQNVIHEDLKADNILLRAASYKAEIVVADFGLARQVQPGERVRPTVPLGTPTQWSPEKAASQGYDFLADVWAATCVLANIFNGDPPWVRFYEAGVLQYVISTQSPPLDDIPQNVTEDIEDLFKQGWTKDVEKRPDARSLLERIDIGHHLSGDRLFSNIGPVFPQSPRAVSLTNVSPTNANKQSGSSANEPQGAVGGVLPGVAIDNSDGRTDSNSSSDTQQHIEQFSKDEYCPIPQPQVLPNLAIFQEPDTEVQAYVNVKVTEFEGFEEEKEEEQQRRRVSIEMPTQRARSPSAPNIGYSDRSPVEALQRINSVDLYGYGPDETSTWAKQKPATSLQNLAPVNPEVYEQHGESSKDVRQGHKHLHLFVPGPGKTPRQRYTNQTSLNVNSNANAYGGARPKMPITASPSLPTVVSKSISPQSTSPWNSQSNSTPNSVEEGSKPGTPKSGQSVREHQERELQSITQSQFQEHYLQAVSAEDLMKLYAGPNNQDDDDESDNDDENKDTDDPRVILQSLGMLNLQPHDPRHQVPPVSPGCLISFVTRDGGFLTKVRIKDASKNWSEVIVDIASPMIHKLSGYQAFSALLPDGSVVDMGGNVGTLDLQVTVVPIDPKSDVHSWYVEDQKFQWSSRNCY